MRLLDAPLKKSFALLFSLLLPASRGLGALLPLLLALPLQATEMPSGPMSKAGLRQVEAKRVCMVTDKVFERDQIPVAVEKKTYYGCCEMCKERLGKDLEVRQATDPVSGKKVDKAAAVIGALPDGSVIYFENAANLQKYSASH